MKKQILFIAFFTLAIFFAGTNAFSQNTEEAYLTAAPTYCVDAIPLTCGAGDALSPIPGVPYDYTILSPTAGTVHWFVTDDADILTALGGLVAGIEPADGTGPYVLDASANYDDDANTSLTVNITWKSFDGSTNDVLLVAYVFDNVTCTNNIEVYRIEPKYSFTLDIAGILDDGTEGATECVSPIVSASYDGTNLNIDYGMNYVYFTVNAANWQTSWMPDNFTASSTDGTSTVGTPEWAYPDQASGAGSIWHTVGVDQVEASHYASNDNGFIGLAGECIIVRVPVTHGAITENIANETINLVVNGEMLDPETSTYSGNYPDLDEPASGSDCIDDLTTDNADYVITPRPDINEDDPTPFENKVPRD